MSAGVFTFIHIATHWLISLLVIHTISCYSIQGGGEIRGAYEGSLHTLIVKKHIISLRWFIAAASLQHTVCSMLCFSYGVRRLASVQSLVRVAYMHHVTGRMQPIRGRAGRVMSSKVVWSKITLLQQLQLNVCWLTGVNIFNYKYRYL